ncbi:MAG: hypothetical protein BGP12_15185 [Rhodospirillales bacterium 70-18]|nr:hypothetical protein [Rhodospirillales bacterium]OJY64440.1 MAG: hypothetical protein BGP12_15185 [Rhodospirillales bacterium 70-18]
MMDALFGTYLAQPAARHAAMTIGLTRFRDPREQRLGRMLTQPLRDGDRAYSLPNRQAAHGDGDETPEASAGR